MNTLISKDERGIAMLIVMFAVLLLTVIGLGMMYSTNMETSINSNFHDKQIALYAALGGLQEARDRIQPATHNITAPIALPSTAAQNVIYIVSDYASVKPWLSGNRYFDTELCQENVLIPPGMPGVPCTTIASGTSWFQYVDDSQSTSAPWNLPYPLDLKWTRITLKANNNTPVAVNGDNSNAAQTCWTGVNQMSTPTGYAAGCQPVGGVTAVFVSNTGTGYTSAPTVSFSGGGGTGAAATAVLASHVVPDGFVSAITVTTGGVAYTSVPTVTITGIGLGATAVATIATSTTVNGYVSAISLTTSGTGYTSTPTVTFSGGGGTGATATVTITTSASVGSVVLDSAGGMCYATAPPVSFTGGSGSGATATAVLETNPSCIYDWTTSGSCTNQLNIPNGYNPRDIKSGVTFNAGNRSLSATLKVQAANDKTVLTYPSCCTIQNPGYDTVGYLSNFTSFMRLSASTWPDCSNITVTATVGRRLASVTFGAGGTGYSSAPTVSIATGVGTTVTAPTAHTTIGAVGITGITLTNGGTGYTSAPTVTISGGGGSGASATASVITTSSTVYYVSLVTVTAGGTGYTAIPAVSFSGGGGAGAVAVASITTSNTSISYVDHINVTAGGSGYSTNPTVTLAGGGGTAATATSQISGGTKFGQVWLLTSFAETRSGARSMVQMEVASPVLGYGVGAALTLDGPNPIIDAMPNSMGFTVSGADANSCLETADEPHPAIDGYDDPNANPPTSSVEIIKNSLPRPDHYTGSGGTPAVQNGFASLGETMTTPIGLKALIDAIKVRAIYYDSTTVGTFNPSATTRPSVTYVEGNLTLGGSGSGYGILVVTGTLTMSGNFSWHGLVFVVGDGHAEFNGGGTGQIVGSIFISKIWDGYATKNLLSSLGSPTLNWNGGGGNGVSYDHCWTDNLMTAIPFTPPPSTKPLKVLSTRVLPY